MGKKGIDKQQILNRKTGDINRPLSERKLTGDLAVDAAALQDLFDRDDTFKLREVINLHDPGLRFTAAYCGGMVDNTLVGDQIIRPLSGARLSGAGPALLEEIMTRVVYIHNPAKADNYRDLVEAVTAGDTLLFVPGCREVLVLATQGYPLRGITEPEGEKILSGPKEGFCESLITNLTFLHRRLHTNDLKMEMRTFGRRSRTKACVSYLDSLVKKDVLEELFRRLEQIDIDGVLDVNYFTELIRDNRYSPFRTIGYTERPDVVAAKLLEGRIAVFLDGTPVVLTLPYLFIENFQSNEDYYLSFYYTSFSRMLRIFGFFLTILVPAIYLAITTYHHEVLPTPLLINITYERQNVPFPMALELFIMLIMFDILRETGIRMPSGVGQAMSVVGALVLGSAAVEAKIVSSLVIIVVALTGITGLLVPKLNAPIITVRLGILLCAALMGFPGLTLAVSVLIAHILSLSSFGVPQITMTGRPRAQHFKDIAIRAPFWQMLHRPRETAAETRRMGKEPRGWDQ